MEESNLSNHPERYRLLFENSFEAMMIFEQDGNILEVNQQMADLVGYRVEELIGKKVYEFMLPIEREDAVGRAQKASTGQALPLVERTIIRKDGSKFVGEANLSPIMDEDGNVLFLFGVLRDLTERKKLEEELSEKETQLRQIGDNLPNGYIYRLIHKPDGQRSVSYISQGVERMYGVSVEEALQDINILYGMMLPEDLQAVIVAEEASIRNQERFNWDGRFRLRNGEINWSRYHSKPTVLPDGTRIWDGVALDITERKQAEKSLLESENTTRALLNALIDIALLTKPDGTILAGNQALADSLGETLDNLIGKNAFNYFPIEIAKARRARSAEVIKSGVPVQFEDTRNGRWFRNHIYPIMTNDGVVNQLAIYVHDITERKSLHQISRELTNITDLPATLECVCGIVETLFNAKFVSIAITHKDEKINTITQSEPTLQLPQLIPLSETPIIQEIISSGESYTSTELQTAPQLPEIRSWAKKLNLNSVLLTPLIVRGEVFGFLLVSTDQKDRVFSKSEIDLAETISGDIASAVENARLFSLVHDQAVADERVRIARELHDSVTQTMYSVSMVAEALPRLLDRNLNEAKRRAIHLRQMTLGALAEMRNLLFEFHPKALQDTSLSILLQQLGDVLTGRIRIPVNFSIEGNTRLPEEVKVAFYRVAQEAFNNIAKHASATDVTVDLQANPNESRLSIQDNGIGFSPDAVNSEKLGLKIMRERAEEIGADLTVESAPNQGTQVSLVWSGLPVEESE